MKETCRDGRKPAVLLKIGDFQPVDGPPDFEDGYVHLVIGGHVPDPCGRNPGMVNVVCGLHHHQWAVIAGFLDQVTCPDCLVGVEP